MANEQNIGKITINGISLPIVGSPYVGSNGNWWVWNTNSQQYEDSTYSAVTTGNQGIQGVGISPSSVGVITEGADAGKLQFTLYDPATGTTQNVMTTNSVQGVGIGSVTINNRKLQISFIDPKTGEPPETPATFTTTNTVIPAVAAGVDTRQFTIEVGGTSYTSPILQGVSIDDTVDATINNDGTLTLPLINPFDNTSSSITTDKTIQGVGVSDVDIENRQLVFTLTNPITGVDLDPITVDTNIVPVFSWGTGANADVLTVNVADTNVSSGHLIGPQGYQGKSVTAVDVSTSGEDIGTLTLTLTDPSTGNTETITATGLVWGPQGYQGKGISGINVNADNTITFTISDPSGATQPTDITTSSAITVVGSNIPMSSSDSTKVQTAITTNSTSIGTLSSLNTTAKTNLVDAINELYTTSPIHIATAAPTTSATAVQKRKLWVNTSTGISYVWTGSAWLALGAVWK